MTNAPERIWIEGAVSNEVWKHDKQSCLSPHEYTRTDLIAAMIDEAVQAEREACAAMIEATAYTTSGDGRRLEPVTGVFVGMDMHHATIAAAIRARKGGA